MSSVVRFRKKVEYRSRRKWECNCFCPLAACGSITSTMVSSGVGVRKLPNTGVGRKGACFRQMEREVLMSYIAAAIPIIETT